MKFAKKKTKASLIAIILTLTLVVTFAAELPNTSAVSYYHSYVYVAVTPNIIGVGQQVLVQYFTADLPPDIGEETSGQGTRAGWDNVWITIKDPAGATEKISIKRTDSVGGAYIAYTPNQVGIYYAKGFFPATWKNSTSAQSFYGAAESNETAFTVQAEPIPAWAESPLPTEPWTRPINSASRAWNVLAGNWLGGDAMQPIGTAGGNTQRFVYGEGPESAHILWTKPYYVGGIMDESFGDTGYQTGHYQGLSFEAIIINGKIYYPYRADAHQTEGYLAVDLYTGETLSYTNGTMPSRGQIYNYDSPNQHGGYAYLWRSPAFNFFGPPSAEPPIWEMLDAYTGRSICKVANVSMGTSFFGTSYGGTGVYGKDGSLLTYNIVNYGTPAAPKYYLTVWNMSAIDSMLAASTGTGYWQWRPSGGGFPGIPLGYYVHDGRTGYSLNVSIPNIDGPRNAILNQTGSIYCIREDEFVIAGTSGQNNELGVVPGYLVKLSLEYGKEGTKLWDKTFTPPFASIDLNQTGGGFFSVGLTMVGVYPEYDVIIFKNPKLLNYYAISTETGQQLWESEPEEQMNFYTMITNVYEGKLLTCGFGGVLNAYNITTGEILWSYTAKNEGFESPYGNYPLNIFAICDGKLYTLTGEHSISQPIWRGHNLRCINATDGTEIWKLLNFGANGGASLQGQYLQMADGKVVGLNFFDNMIYCIGKGSSDTTVMASPKTSVHGTSVLIEGAVTDATDSGKRNTNDLLDFSLNGTPAISDEDMGAWMEYMFMQQAFPADAKGVEVVLETLDPNGNYFEIGRTTSDINGNYGFMFTPEVSGEYQIFATFKGSKSYGSSHASTFIGVAEAPEATTQPTLEPASMTDQYFLPLSIGMIIAIIVAAIAIILVLLRKR